MDNSKEVQLAKEMVEICKKISLKENQAKKPWKSIILSIVITSLAGAYITPNGWGGIPD